MDDLGNCTPGAGAIVAAARAIVDQAEIVCTRSVSALDAESCREDGFPNVSDWMMANTNAIPGEGARRQRHAELLAKLPLWADAASAGTIGYAQIQLLSGVMTKRRFVFAQRDEAILLQSAIDSPSLDSARSSFIGFHCATTPSLRQNPTMMLRPSEGSSSRASTTACGTRKDCWIRLPART